MSARFYFIDRRALIGNIIDIMLQLYRKRPRNCAISNSRDRSRILFMGPTMSGKSLEICLSIFHHHHRPLESSNRNLWDATLEVTRDVMHMTRHGYEYSNPASIVYVVKSPSKLISAWSSNAPIRSYPRFNEKIDEFEWRMKLSRMPKTPVPVKIDAPASM